MFNFRWHVKKPIKSKTTIEAIIMIMSYTCLKQVNLNILSNVRVIIKVYTELRNGA